MTHRTLQELAALCGATLEGDAAIRVKGPAALLEAEPDDIGFCGHARYASELAGTRAAAVLVPHAMAVPRKDLALLRSPTPLESFERLLTAFDRLRVRPPSGVHATAVVAPSARIGRDVHIGAYCVIGDDVELGERAVLHSHVVVGRRCRIGADSELHAHVVLYDFVTLGARCMLHSGAVLGGDGFGFDAVLGPRGLERWAKFPHGGTVTVEDDVEIGCNCTIDRGRFGATRIGRGAKLDNLVHVGHNVQIDEHALLIAQVGIAGSARIGSAAIVAGKSGIGQGVSIGPGARLAPFTGAFEDLEGGADYGGHWAQPKGEWMRTQVHLRRLSELFQRVKALEAARGAEEAR